DKERQPCQEIPRGRSAIGVPGHDVRDVEEVEPPPQNERGKRRPVEAATTPERRDANEREQVDRRTRYEAERAVEEKARHPDLGRVVQDLLLVADEEIPRTRDEPAEESPVEVTEQQHERGEGQRR